MIFGGFIFNFTQEVEMLAVIDQRMPRAAVAALEEFCETVKLPPFSALDRRVASHPDMLIFGLDGKLFVCKDYYDEAKEQIDFIASRSELEIVLTSDTLSDVYPHDVAFNSFVVCDTLFGNEKYISQEIKDEAEATGVKLCSVKQGYAKCSTVVLKNAVISADKGICDAAESLGADALLISAGGVALDGYDCGFIGGASIKLSGDCVAFFGDIKYHPSHEKIREFANAHNVRLIALSDEPLIDFGGGKCYNIYEKHEKET
jgi:hypothetical protein